MGDTRFPMVIIAVALIFGSTGCVRSELKASESVVSFSSESYFNATSMCSGPSIPMGCLGPFVESYDGSIVVNGTGTNGTLEAVWETEPDGPAEWRVYLVLVRGGTWAIGEGVRSPFSTALSADLVPGEYALEIFPNEPFAGSISQRIAWRVTATFNATISS